MEDLSGTDFLGQGLLDSIIHGSDVYIVLWLLNAGAKVQPRVIGAASSNLLDYGLSGLKGLKVLLTAPGLIHFKYLLFLCDELEESVLQRSSQTSQWTRLSVCHKQSWRTCR